VSGHLADRVYLLVPASTGRVLTAAAPLGDGNAHSGTTADMDFALQGVLRTTADLEPLPQTPQIGDALMLRQGQKPRRPGLFRLAVPAASSPTHTESQVIFVSQIWAKCRSRTER
jgi:hypothetical protein